MVTLDGKALRRSLGRAAAAPPPLQPVSAGAVEQRLVLGQLAVDGEANGITAVPRLLAMPALRGTIVTADALNCRRAVAERVPRRGGDDVPALRGNRGTPPPLHDDARTFLDDPATPVVGRTPGPMPATAGSRSAPRPRQPRCDAWLREHPAWPGLAAPGKVVARREGIGGGTTVEARYALLGTALGPGRFNRVVRLHGDLENGLPRGPDVVPDEDGARDRKDHGPENLALVRRLALDPAELEPSQGATRGQPKRAGRDNAFLARPLAQFAPPQMR